MKNSLKLTEKEMSFLLNDESIIYIPYKNNLDEKKSFCFEIFKASLEEKELMKITNLIQNYTTVIPSQMK